MRIAIVLTAVLLSACSSHEVGQLAPPDLALLRALEREHVEALPPAIATPAPTPEPTQTPQETPQPLSRLTEEEFHSLARTVGFQREHVIDEAYRVACGGGSTRWGESACRPDAENVNEHGRFIGLFQIWDEWAEFCGVKAEHLFYAAVNLACVNIILRHSERIGLDRWQYWQVKP